MYDFDYTMQNLFGDEMRICGFDNGAAFVKFIDPISGFKSISFDSERAAYDYAFNRGFRD